MTSKAEHYRAKARKSEEIAEQTGVPCIKDQFLKIAKQWRHMAAYEEKHDRLS